MSCPLCNRTKGLKKLGTSVYQCPRCKAVFGSCYLGDSYQYVKPYFAPLQVPTKRLAYFDLECLGSEGVTRRHGWFDPETRLVHQVG
jgi:hypothetical protein